MFEHLAILEILTVNAQKMGTGPNRFTRIFLWGHVGTRDFDWEHACQI